MYIYCLFVDLSLCLALHFLFFTKISSFIKRSISFQTLGCIFEPELCIVLWKPLHCCLFLVYCHMSVDRHYKFLGEMWVQLCTFEALSLFLLQHSVFQNKKQLLGQINFICQMDKAISNIADWKKCSHISTSWNQIVKPKTVNQLFDLLLQSCFMTS